MGPEIVKAHMVKAGMFIATAVGGFAEVVSVMDRGFGYVTVYTSGFAGNVSLNTDVMVSRAGR